MYANNATHQLDSIFFGYSLNEIINMFELCHNLDREHGVFNQWSWPNGKSMLEQENILTEIFLLYKSFAEQQIQKKIKMQMEKSRKNNAR